MSKKHAKLSGLSIKIIGNPENIETDHLVDQVKTNGLYVPQMSGHDNVDVARIDGCASSVSVVDTRSKYSCGYAQCFGVVAIGCSSDSDEKLSFLFHGNPDYFMNSDCRANLSNALQGKLQELQNRCTGNSLEVVIFAGETKPYWSAEEKSYFNRISFLCSVITKITGVPPTVLVPKFSLPFCSSFYLDTQSSQAVLVQPLSRVIDVNTCFSATRVPCEQMRWRILARQKFKAPVFGCYVGLEW